MMFDIQQSVLIVIDIQGNLAHAMHDKERLLTNTQNLIQACQHLNIPILLTEQAPEKLGSTIQEVSQYLGNIRAIPKLSFSCYGEERFVEVLKATGRRQIIVCGIESHVCMCQTVSDLMDHEYPVQVVADAVSSRTRDNYLLGLDRMKSEGAVMTSTEMLLTELLRTAAHPKFRDILSLIK